MTQSNIKYKRYQSSKYSSTDLADIGIPDEPMMKPTKQSGVKLKSIRRVRSEPTPPSSCKCYCHEIEKDGTKVDCSACQPTVKCKQLKTSDGLWWCTVHNKIDVSSQPTVMSKTSTVASTVKHYPDCEINNGGSCDCKETGLKPNKPSKDVRATEKPMDKWEERLKENIYASHRMALKAFKEQGHYEFYNGYESDEIKYVISFIKDLLKEERARAKVEMLNMVEKPCVTTILSLTAEEALAEYKQKLIKKLVKELEPKLHEFAFKVKGKDIGFKEAKLSRELLDEVEAVIKE